MLNLVIILSDLHNLLYPANLPVCAQVSPILMLWFMPRRLHNWTYPQVVDFLRQNGFRFNKELGGSHQAWTKHGENSARDIRVEINFRHDSYAVLEGESSLVAYGNKAFKDRKNVRSLTHIKKMISRYEPEALMLDDVNAEESHRSPRIKKLHSKVAVLAKGHKLKTMKITSTKLRFMLLGDENGTKHEMAEFLAKRFPDELASRLPPKRTLWKSEDVRMDIFDAVGLVFAAKTGC